MILFYVKIVNSSFSGHGTNKLYNCYKTMCIQKFLITTVSDFMTYPYGDSLV